MGKSVSVKEIGGSKAVRPFWPQYLRNKHAILFVVDAAASNHELQASKEALAEVLAERTCDDMCPCLILGTHADVDGASDADQLHRFFSDTMDEQRWSVRTCCAFNGDDVKAAVEALLHLVLHK